ncbi:MAG: hypothetical protein ACK5R4_06755 [Alphaproteobacteria bacterium]|jgi:hypothetical protein
MGATAAIANYGLLTQGSGTYHDPNTNEIKSMPGVFTLRDALNLAQQDPRNGPPDPEEVSKFIEKHIGQFKPTAEFPGVGFQGVSSAQDVKKAAFSLAPDGVKIPGVQEVYRT